MTAPRGRCFPVFHRFTVLRLTPTARATSAVDRSSSRGEQVRCSLHSSGRGCSPRGTGVQ